MSTDVTSAAAREAAAPTGSEPTRSGPVFLPATNIYETAEGLLLFAEVPGTDPGSISVTLDRAVLRLGARSKMAPPAGYSLIHGEYRHGDYERAFTLPFEVDAVYPFTVIVPLRFVLARPVTVTFVALAAVPAKGLVNDRKTFGS